MNEIKTVITEQLQHLHTLMQRLALHNFMSSSRTRSPHRGQGRVLAILKMKPEISQKELTYVLGMSKQAIAELLGKLEKNGYITREQTEDNKRALMVKLTDEGRKIAESLEEEESATIKALDTFTEEELHTFNELLGKVVTAYESYFPDEDFDERRRVMVAFMTHHGRGFDRSQRPPDRETDNPGEHRGRGGGGGNRRRWW